MCYSKFNVFNENYYSVHALVALYPGSFYFSPHCTLCKVYGIHVFLYNLHLYLKEANFFIEKLDFQWEVLPSFKWNCLCF